MELITGIIKNLPDAISLGILWGIMCLGVYITFKILDIADIRFSLLKNILIYLNKFYRSEKLKKTTDKIL